MNRLADRALALFHDSHWGEWPRIRDLFGERVRVLLPFIDGNGVTLRGERYDQIHDHEPPDIGTMPGYYWHGRAFQRCVEIARDNQWPEFLFIEADCDLLPEFDEVVSKAMEQLDAAGIVPDVLYYGANHHDAATEDVGPNVMRIWCSWTTHCLKIRATAYDAILALLTDQPFDVALSRVHKSHGCYAVWPSVATQRPMRSAIWDKDVDYTGCWATKGANR